MDPVTIAVSILGLVIAIPGAIVAFRALRNASRRKPLRNELDKTPFMVTFRRHEGLLGRRRISPG